MAESTVTVTLDKMTKETAAASPTSPNTTVDHAGTCESCAITTTPPLKSRSTAMTNHGAQGARAVPVHAGIIYLP